MPSSGSSALLPAASVLGPRSRSPWRGHLAAGTERRTPSGRSGGATRRTRGRRSASTDPRLRSRLPPATSNRPLDGAQRGSPVRTGILRARARKKRRKGLSRGSRATRSRSAAAAPRATRPGDRPGWRSSRARPAASASSGSTPAPSRAATAAGPRVRGPPRFGPARRVEPRPRRPYRSADRTALPGASLPGPPGRGELPSP